jgi:hypothetical protein
MLVSTLQRRALVCPRRCCGHHTRELTAGMTLWHVKSVAFLRACAHYMQRKTESGRFTRPRWGKKSDRVLHPFDMAFAFDACGLWRATGRADHRHRSAGRISAHLRDRIGDLGTPILTA